MATKLLYIPFPLHLLSFLRPARNVRCSSVQGMPLSLPSMPSQEGLDEAVIGELCISALLSMPLSVVGEES